jgi:hypothetical protein
MLPAFSKILPGLATGWRDLLDVRAWHGTTKGMVLAFLCFVLEVIAFSIFKVNTKVLAYALSLPSLVFVYFYLRRLAFHWSTIAMIIGSLWMYGTYLGYTSHNERNLDVGAQVTYIEYLVDNLRAPPDNHCFICHHPPLYYSVAGVVYALTKWLDVAPPLRGVQMVSLVSIFFLVLCTAAITRRFTDRPWAVTVAAGLCGLWPYTIIFSARIHNDVLATVLMVWTIYFCVRWYQDEDRASLWGALLSSGLSVFTKMNGLEVVALLMATIGFKALFKPNKIAFLRPLIPPVLILAVILGGFIATRGSGKEKKEDQKEQAKKDEAEKAEQGENAEGAADEAPVAGERLFGSAFRIGERAWMGNEPFNYVYFDIENFLQEPFILAHKEGTGRQYFLNHWLKSSLFSTSNERPDAETSYRFNHRVAQFENFLLLCLIAYFLAFIVQAKKPDLKRQFVLTLAFAVLFAGAAAFRIIVPHAHHVDFRLSFPILVPFCIAFGLATAHYSRKNSSMEHVGYLLLIAFLGGSVLFFTPKYKIIQKYSPTHWIDKKPEEIAMRARAGTKWNDDRHLILEGTDGLRVTLDPPREVNRVEVSADHNDLWELKVVGATETRTLQFGPHPDNKAGIAIYVEDIEPAVENVKEVTFRPLDGDRAYSIGHVVINDGAP